jgi:hypothetical protein
LQLAHLVLVALAAQVYWAAAALEHMAMLVKLVAHMGLALVDLAVEMVPWAHPAS